MRVAVITPPDPIISVPEVQQRVPSAADVSGDVIEPLIAAACAQIEPPLGWTGRAFGLQTLELRGDEFSWRLWSRGVMLTAPVVSVTSVKYLDSLGTEQTLDPANYELQGDRIALTTDASSLCVYASHEPVRVRFVAGYALDAPQLEPAKRAVCVMVRQSLALDTEDLFLRSETVDGIGSQSRAVTDTAIALMAKSAENLLHPYRVY
jgi:uncharacterized phiE125 gp8 family phage protein